MATYLTITYVEFHSSPSILSRDIALLEIRANGRTDGQPRCFPSSALYCIVGDALSTIKTRLHSTLIKRSQLCVALYKMRFQPHFSRSIWGILKIRLKVRKRRRVTILFCGQPMHTRFIGACVVGLGLSINIFTYISSHINYNSRFCCIIPMGVCQIPADLSVHVIIFFSYYNLRVTCFR